MFRKKKKWRPWNIFKFGESECYVVSGVIKGSKQCSGYRRLIYEDAQRWRACYDFRNPEHSIWYPENNDDLCISLMFKHENEAVGFLGQLATYYANSKFKFGVTFEDEPVMASLTARELTDLRHVFITHYKPDFSDSPSNSRDCSICNSDAAETAYGGEPEKGLRSLEDLSKLAHEETIYKCHIAGQTPHPDFKHDADNVIYGSHLFHAYFDGDGKRPPREANVNWGIAPKLLLEFLDAEPEPIYVAGKPYWLISVKVVFRHPEAARAMDGKWREGSKELNELETSTYFYSQSASQARKLLRIKEFETRRRWRHCDGESVDFSEEFVVDSL